MGCATQNFDKPFRFVNGKFFCEGVDIQNLFETLTNPPNANPDDQGDETHEIPVTPAYVYSLAKVRQNVQGYVDGMKEANLSGRIGYAIKANPNIHLVEKMKSFGVKMIIAVSGYEVMAGIKAGFEPKDILLNGNGKQPWEVQLAIEKGVMMNVDSVFDAKQIVQIHKKLKNENEVEVLLRIRPAQPRNEEAKLRVHEYINTAENSKFGFEFSELDEILNILKSRNQIKVVGVHCHFGSCIDNAKVYEWLGETITNIVSELARRNVSIKVLNVGGGIGIDYQRIPPGFLEFLRDQDKSVYESYESIAKLPELATRKPSISNFMSALAKTVPQNTNLIVEPGRSLIGDAGVLICKVLGVKKTDERKFLVVDGSMNEVIRPCLYGSHHGIFPTTIQPQDKWESCDVVGPICESADFLGKNVPVQTASKYVSVMDCGAYCNSMSSNYNLRPRVAEILVDGEEWSYIKKREDFEDIIRNYSAT